MKLRGKKATEILGQTVLWVILIASLLIFSVPFFFMITNSFEEFSYPYPAGARHSKVRSQVAEQPVYVHLFVFQQPRQIPLFGKDK